MCIRDRTSIGGAAPRNDIWAERASPTGKSAEMERVIAGSAGEYIAPAPTDPERDGPAAGDAVTMIARNAMFIRSGPHSGGWSSTAVSQQSSGCHIVALLMSGRHGVAKTAPHLAHGHRPEGVRRADLWTFTPGPLAEVGVSQQQPHRDAGSEQPIEDVYKRQERAPGRGSAALSMTTHSSRRQKRRQGRRSARAGGA